MAARVLLLEVMSPTVAEGGGEICGTTGVRTRVEIGRIRIRALRKYRIRPSIKIRITAHSSIYLIKKVEKC